MSNSNKDKPITFKTHFFSALFRALFTNTSLIFVNSVFIKAVGGENYSQLFFVATLVSLSYYIYFAIRGDKKAYNVYEIVLGLSLIASILCFLEPFTSALTPYNHILLYFFAVSVVAVDLIGTSVGPVVLQLSVNPAIFRDVFQKIVTSELVARVTSAALVWVLSYYHLLEYCYPVAWVTLIAHFFLFKVLVTRLKRVEKASIAKDEKKEVEEITVKEKITRAAKFILSNSMVKTAMTLMMWGHASKFTIEFLFYQAADQSFDKPSEIAAFISGTTMVMILLSLLLQPTVGKSVIKKFQLSTLYSIQPINILILGSLALLINPFWPLVLLLVTYNIINRTVQVPISRQCLVPIPRNQRSTIVSVIYIMMSASTMTLSGLMVSMKDFLGLQDWLIMLIILGTVIFFVITGLDSYYIRNLWSFYREARSGRWQDEPESENLSTVAVYSEEVKREESAIISDDARSQEILKTYAYSYDNEKLEDATKKHQEFLHSEKEELIILGLKICFISGFPWLEKYIEDALDHPSKKVKDYAKILVDLNGQFSSLTGYNSVFRRRIKSLSLEFSLDSSNEYLTANLSNLLNLPDEKVSKSIVRLLKNTRYTDYRIKILSCISDRGNTLNMEPLIDYMYQSSFDQAALYREVIEKLSLNRNAPELISRIEKNIGTFDKSELAFWKEPESSGRQSKDLNRFMHTLFLEEYRLCPEELDHTVTDTIGEFAHISVEDLTSLVDMHMEFLKRSENIETWRHLFSR